MGLGALLLIDEENMYKEGVSKRIIGFCIVDIILISIANIYVSNG